MACANAHAEIVLHKGVHILLTDPDGSPISDGGEIPTFTVWNRADQSIFQVPIDEETRAFFGVAEPTDLSPALNETNSIDSSGICIPGEPYKDMERGPQVFISKDSAAREPVTSFENTTRPECYTDQTSTLGNVAKTVASWKDDAAVRHLIETWKKYEGLFKSGTMRHETVWRMVAEDLSTANSQWIFTGVQCGNKIKDLRKSWVKVRDHNNQTGAAPKTCKFFDEMDEVLGEKPCVKPLTLASNLKRKGGIDFSCSIDDDGSHQENDINSAKNKNTKKTRVQKELSEWSEVLRADAQKREQAREQRHLQSLNTFKDLFSKLTEKL